MKWETVFIVKPGPPPGSFEPLPKVQAVLIRLYPKPGILTHISRGMESIPAVFVMGSTVTKIKVSVQKGQPPSVGSSARSPTNRILIRLLPSQVGYCSSSEPGGSGVKVEGAVFRSGIMTKLSTGFTGSPTQSAGGIPGNEVRRQQIVKARTKKKRPAALTNATPQNTIRRVEND